MSSPNAQRNPSPSSDPDAEAWVAAIRLAWRSLTGGPDAPDESRQTLVACSGGVDSAALAIALGSVSRARVVVAFIAHDLRPAELVADDAMATRRLARRLDRPFVLAHAPVGPGNAEASARQARYRALGVIADRLGVATIATAHHAHDQLESMVMGLLRGGSPSAIAGISPCRAIDDTSAELIRPMLGVTPAGAAAVCREFGYRPRIDHTNADPSSLRAAMRRQSLSDLAQRTEGLPTRLARAHAALIEAAAQPAPDSAK